MAKNKTIQNVIPINIKKYGKHDYKIRYIIEIYIILSVSLQTLINKTKNLNYFSYFHVVFHVLSCDLLDTIV